MRKLWLCAISALFLMAAPASASLILPFTASSAKSSYFAVTAGWAFTVNSAITVTALDDFGPLPQIGSFVEIYDGSGNVYASATVLSTDPIVGTAPANFNSHAIASVTLNPGTYYIAADLLNGQKYNYKVTGLTMPSSVTYLNSVLAFGTGQKPTSNPYGYSNDPAYFGPDFEFVNTNSDSQTATPEPATICSAFTAIGIGLISRRRLSRRMTVCEGL